MGSESGKLGLSESADGGAARGGDARATSDTVRDASDEGPGGPAAALLDERRRLVEVRRAFAERAVREAETAEGRLHEMERERDRRLQCVVEAERALDADAVRGAKEAAHQTFRAGVRTAAAHRDVEVAAAAWLEAINSINAGVRAAKLRIDRERAYADKLLPDLGRLAKAAASARATADNAGEASEAAEEALRAAELEAAAAAAARGDASPAKHAKGARRGAQRGDAAATAVRAAAAAADSAAQSAAGLPAASPEAAAAAPLVGPPAAPAVPPVPAPAPAPVLSPAARWAVVAAVPPPLDPDLSPDGRYIDLGAKPECVMLRLLRRDRRVMTRLVARIAGPKPTEQSRVQILVSEFVDAVCAAAIDAAFFGFPHEDAFWGNFSKEQSRDIVLGLAALGHRYDGMGGFADDRIPNHRDLALALGHAGLNPTRMRQWPDRDAIAELYRQIVVEADAFLAARAPALTLGELVRLLGRRAERLTDLWNEWPRIRPLLLAPD